jgi:hypothetical protein
MGISKEKLKDYLELGLISAEEQEILLSRSDNDTVDDSVRLDIISLLEKNIKINEANLEEIERNEAKLDDDYKKAFTELRRKSKEIEKQTADELYQNLNKIKDEQEKILQDFEMEMDRLDRKMFENLEFERKNFHGKILEKVRQKIK